jgi:hypothetical protein
MSLAMGEGRAYGGGMGSDEERHGWSAAKFSCPVCKQPVQAVATRRRKVFGAYVPVWEPGPCENPACPAKGKAQGSSAAGETEEREQPQPG